VADRIGVGSKRFNLQADEFGTLGIITHGSPLPILPFFPAAFVEAFRVAGLALPSNESNYHDKTICRKRQDKESAAANYDFEDDGDNLVASHVHVPLRPYSALRTAGPTTTLPHCQDGFKKNRNRTCSGKSGTTRGFMSHVQDPATAFLGRCISKWPFRPSSFVGSDLGGSANTIPANRLSRIVAVTYSCEGE
jgi:hypothetical protein